MNGLPMSFGKVKVGNRMGKGKKEVPAPVESILKGNQDKTPELEIRQEMEDLKKNDIESPVISMQEYEAILPISQEFSFSPHKKAITALAIDVTGTRLVTGSQDGAALKFFDFPTMDKTMKNFRELEVPCGFVVHNHLKFNKSGELFVLVPNSNQPKIYTKDAALKGDFQIGDTYLSDLSKTFGHTGPVKGADWHPYKKNIIMTASQDSTIRIWDLETFKTKCSYTVKAKNDKGHKIGLTACAYHPFGKYFAGGCLDGGIQIFSEAGPYHRPEMLIKNAHLAQEISCIKFSEDDRTLVSRSLDNTMKVWDIRKSTVPLKVFDNLLNLWEQTDCIFDEKENFIVTGTSGEKNTGNGEIVFVDKEKLEICHRRPSKGSVIRLAWNARINQIIVGSSDHSLHFYFDPDKSKHGIMDAVSKEVRSKYMDEELMFSGHVYVPNALPMFAPTISESLAKYRERKDPEKTKLPQKPDTTIGPGYRGKIGTSSTQYLLKQAGVKEGGAEKFMDPRDAILRYAKEAEENPQFVDNAYKKNQPVKYFDASHIEPNPKKKKFE